MSTFTLRREPATEPLPLLAAWAGRSMAPRRAAAVLMAGNEHRARTVLFAGTNRGWIEGHPSKMRLVFERLRTELLCHGLSAPASTRAWDDSPIARAATFGAVTVAYPSRTLPLDWSIEAADPRPAISRADAERRVASGHLAGALPAHAGSMLLQIGGVIGDVTEYIPNDLAPGTLRGVLNHIVDGLVSARSDHTVLLELAVAMRETDMLVAIIDLLSHDGVDLRGRPLAYRHALALQTHAELGVNYPAVLDLRRQLPAGDALLVDPRARYGAGQYRVGER